MLGKTITIAIDAMGGDYGLSVTVPAALQTLRIYPKVHLILVGMPGPLGTALEEISPLFRERLSIHPASQEVLMHEAPALALRTKKDSSMRLAIDLVKEGQADACVSAGNTGALMATARFVLKMLPGIDRPAIVSALPTEKEGRQVLILDLGANVDCTAEHLYQFAVMGSVLASAFQEEGEASQSRKKEVRPKVALLSNGEEDIKGNEQVKEAAQKLTATSALQFVGYVEGDDLFLGNVDVVVCDGFVGNVALKTIEGTAHLIAHYLKDAFMRNTWTRLVGWLGKPILRQFRSHVDPRQYNGASLLGLRGIVVKSHGHADVTSFQNAITIAIKQAQQGVPDQIASRVEAYLKD